MSGLPDLNQTVPEVANTLLHWINWLVEEFQFDGVRVDTVPEIHPDFWAQFQVRLFFHLVGVLINTHLCELQASAGVFGMGEVYDWRVSYVGIDSFHGLRSLDLSVMIPPFSLAPYEEDLDSVLSYPLYFTLMNVFAWKQSMYQIQSMLQQYYVSFKDPSVLGPSSSFSYCSYCFLLLPIVLCCF